MKKIKFYSMIMRRLIVFFIEITLLIGIGSIMILKLNSLDVQDMLATDDINCVMNNYDDLMSQIENTSKGLSESTLVKEILFDKLADGKYGINADDSYIKNQMLTEIIRFEKYPIQNIKFFDASGEIVYSYNSNKYGSHEYNITKRALSGESITGFFNDDEVDRIILISSYPVNEGGKIIGAINTTYNIDESMIDFLKNNRSFELRIIPFEDILYVADTGVLRDKPFLSSSDGKVILSESLHDILSSTEAIHIERLGLLDKTGSLNTYVRLLDYEKNEIGLMIITKDITSILSRYRKIYTLGIVALILIFGVSIHFTTKYLRMLRNSMDTLRSDMANMTFDDSDLKKADDIRIYEIYDLANDFSRVIKRISRQKLNNIVNGETSNTDDLTGFWNHKQFFKMLSTEVERGNEFSICLIDIDKFRGINSKFSHNVGDSVIKALGEIISENYCKYEFFRYGGEEFAIIMKDTSVIDAYKYAEDIRTRVEESSIIPRILSGEKVTITIGISSFSRQAANIDMLVDKAEKALEFGKNHGRNQSNIYDNEVDVFFENSKENSKEFLSIHDAVESLITTLEEKDVYSGNHSKLVQKYSLQIGERIGMSKKLLENLGISSILHDIGKIGVPDTILSSTQKLNSEDYNIAMEHTTIGYNIARRLVEDPNILAGIKSHHERWDGKGYPDGLKDEEIPLFARIIGIADAYQSMVFGSHYRERKLMEEAINDMLENSGKQFDPYLVDVFIDIIRENYS